MEKKNKDEDNISHSHAEHINPKERYEHRKKSEKDLKILKNNEDKNENTSTLFVKGCSCSDKQN